MLVGAKNRERGQIEELVGDLNPGSKALPMSQKRQERREQRVCQGIRGLKARVGRECCISRRGGGE